MGRVPNNLALWGRKNVPGERTARTKLLRLQSAWSQKSIESSACGMQGARVKRKIRTDQGQGHVGFWGPHKISFSLGVEPLKAVVQMQ